MEAASANITNVPRLDTSEVREGRRFPGGCMWSVGNWRESLGTDHRASPLLCSDIFLGQVKSKLMRTLLKHTFCISPNLTVSVLRT